MITPLLAILALVGSASTTSAEETRSENAHAHGHSLLNIAFDGNKVAMELEAPGMDIVGFEHPATSPEDRAKVAAAIADLEQPMRLFVMDKAARCTMIEAKAALEEEDHDDHDDHEEKNDHGDEEDKDHKEHEKAEHDDGDEKDEAGHTEFHANYLFKCDNPGAVTGIDFVFFQSFPNAQEIDIQMISDSGTSGFEVERDEPRLEFPDLK